MYSVQVMKGVIEEKTNRVVEIVISSVTTFQLMMAKIIGVGLVGITQFFILTLVTFIMSITILPKLIPDKYNPAIQIDSNNFNASMRFLIHQMKFSIYNL